MGKKIKEDKTFYDLGFSFLCLHKARRPTDAILTTLKRTPGISPLECPERPNPATKTSSFSSMKLREPSKGTKAETFFPFLINWTRTPLRTAELGCFDSIPLLNNDKLMKWLVMMMNKGKVKMKKEMRRIKNNEKNE